MFPSKSDHDLTGGLFGTLNGKRDDDFMDRDGNALNGNEEFNRYWRYVFYIFHIIIIFYFKSDIFNI